MLLELARKKQPSPKLCERCDAFFPSLGSETCPQCFAPLTALTAEEANQAARAQIERLQDPEYVSLKSQDDERFKEESFGACLAVVGILTLALAVSLFLIYAAAHHKTIAAAFKAANNRTLERPIANESMLPMSLGNTERTNVTTIMQSDENPVPLLHCLYGPSIQVYVLPATGANATTLGNFREIVQAVCIQTNPPFISQEVHGKLAYYDIIGANGGLVGDAAQKINSLVGQ